MAKRKQIKVALPADAARHFERERLQHRTSPTRFVMAGVAAFQLLGGKGARRNEVLHLVTLVDEGVIAWRDVQLWVESPESKKTDRYKAILAKAIDPQDASEK